MGGGSDRGAGTGTPSGVPGGALAGRGCIPSGAPAPWLLRDPKGLPTFPILRGEAPSGTLRRRDPRWVRTLRGSSRGSRGRDSSVLLAGDSTRRPGPAAALHVYSLDRFMKLD